MDQNCEPEGWSPNPTRSAMHRTRTMFTSAVVVLSMCIGCTTTPDGTGADGAGADGATVSPKLIEANAVVEKVVDGDTIIVRSHGEREHVRLIGVNTPETVHPTKPVECFGKEASTFTKKLLPKGTPVHLVRDTESRDRYGRLLGYVFRASDSKFVNLILVLEGYATAYRFPPNVTFSEQFAQAQGQARENGAGLWSVCENPPPG